MDFLFMCDLQTDWKWAVGGFEKGWMRSTKILSNGFPLLDENVQ